jgi:hypothetical protein
VEEYQLKAKFLTGLPQELELFETLCATRKDGCVRLQRHLCAAYASSAQYFGIALRLARTRIGDRESACHPRRSEVYRLRVTLGPTVRHMEHPRIAAGAANGGSGVLVAEVELDERRLSFCATRATVRAHLDARVEGRRGARRV